MAYRARIGETPQSLSNSDLTERIEQLRTSATDSYRQGDPGATEVASSEAREPSGYP